MNKRAIEAALTAYPDRGVDAYSRGRKKTYRQKYIEGYEQAEEDIISIIESRLSELLGDAQPTPILRYELQDLIKKIKEEKQ